MAKPLQFQLMLTGNFAQSLGPVNKGLGETNKKAHEAAEGVKFFEGELGNLKGSLGGLSLNLSALHKGGPLFTFDLIEGVKSAIEGVTELAEKFIDLGKEIVGVAGATQDLNLAVKLTAGPEMAEKVNELAESFSKTTRFDDDLVKKSLLPFLDLGIKDIGILDDLATASADVSARLGTGAEGYGSAMEAFHRLMLKGDVSDKILRPLNIEAKEFWKRMGAIKGVTGETAEKMAKAGKFGREMLAQGVLGMLAERQGGAIGAPALAAGSNLGGTLARLANLKEEVFKKIAEGEGMKKLQAALDRFSMLMKGEAGDKLMASFDRLFVKVGEFLTPKRIQEWVDGLANIGSWFESIKGTVSKVVTFSEIAASVWAGIKIVNVITSLVGLLPALGTAMGTVVGVFTAISAPVIAIGAALAAVGVAIWRIVDAVKELGGLKAVWNDFKDFVGGSGPALAGGAVNENSPAWKKAKAAGLPAGTSLDIAGLPQFAGGGVVMGPTLALIGEAGPEVVVPLSAQGSFSDFAKSGGFPGGGASVVFSPTIQVSGGGEEAAGQVGQVVRVEFGKIMAEAGYAVGAV
jgi:tape measure domain-containing protein